MNLLVPLLLLLPYSPSDSAQALLTIRDVPLRALLFAEQAARYDGQGVLQLGRLLELAGRFPDAARVYSLAAGEAGPGAAGWLPDRLRGVSTLDTTLVLEASLRNNGDSTVRNVILMVPKPTAHQPYQNMWILESDFTGGGPVLTCLVDSLSPGGRVSRSIRVRILQRPHTFRPIAGALNDLLLATLVNISREAQGTRSNPGPCLEMSRELVRRAGEIHMPMHVAGGLVYRGDSLVFHAWAVLDSIIPGLPFDPLLMKSDSMMAVGHCPSDMIPLWNLDYTDGCELSALYSGGSALEMTMRAYFAGR